MAVEFRICWSAITNPGFRGETEWERWKNPEHGPEDVDRAMYEGAGALCEGLDRALLASGFEWWVETREVSGVA